MGHVKEGRAEKFPRETKVSLLSFLSDAPPAVLLVVNSSLIKVLYTRWSSLEKARHGRLGLKFHEGFLAMASWIAVEVLRSRYCALYRESSGSAEQSWIT